MEDSKGYNNDKDFPRKVAIVWDHSLFSEAAKVSHISKRVWMVHALISSYNLCKHMKKLESKPASDWDLSSFHSSDFIEYLKSINQTINFDEEKVSLKYGLGYDCPPLIGIYDYVCAIVGGTLAAVRALVDKSACIAINWCGGWHHAGREKAEGFCYANDVVIAILELQLTFEKILYLDLDVHHCNGVEECFSYTNKVLTVSLHQFESGFYPGTGSLEDNGNRTGKYFTVNVPLREGITDDPYVRLFKSVFESVTKRFTPDAVVVQAGADSISGDRLGSFNLSPIALAAAISQVLSLKKPTLILGGGGYNLVNTAKCWTFLTSIIVGCDLPSDIPDHQYFTSYGPDFDLEIIPGNRKDLNTEEYLQHLMDSVENNCAKMISK